MNISPVQSQYQTISPRSAPKPVGYEHGIPVYDLEIITFESLLSERDKKTLAAMEDFGAKNGISELEMEMVKDAIAGEKLFAPHMGKPNPAIDRNLMSKIVDGDEAGRVGDRAARMLLSNFHKFQDESMGASNGMSESGGTDTSGAKIEEIMNLALGMGKPVPVIEEDFMIEMLDDIAKVDRTALDSQAVQLMLSDFRKTQSINILA